jgi:hypothetical protein
MFVYWYTNYTALTLAIYNDPISNTLTNLRLAMWPHGELITANRQSCQFILNCNLLAVYCKLSV